MTPDEIKKALGNKPTFASGPLPLAHSDRTHDWCNACNLPANYCEHAAPATGKEVREPHPQPEGVPLTTPGIKWVKPNWPSSYYEGEK
jgi:hypothetical protein